LEPALESLLLSLPAEPGQARPAPGQEEEGEREEEYKREEEWEWGEESGCGEE